MVKKNKGFLGGGKYTVQAGDNLNQIAMDIYGDEKFVKQLTYANRLKDDIMTPGTVLKLPVVRLGFVPVITNQEAAAYGFETSTGGDGVGSFDQKDYQSDSMGAFGEGKISSGWSWDDKTEIFGQENQPTGGPQIANGPDRGGTGFEYPGTNIVGEINFGDMEFSGSGPGVRGDRAEKYQTDAMAAFSTPEVTQPEEYAEGSLADQVKGDLKEPVFPSGTPEALIDRYLASQNHPMHVDPIAGTIGGYTPEQYLDYFDLMLQAGNVPSNVPGALVYGGFILSSGGVAMTADQMRAAGYVYNPLLQTFIYNANEVPGTDELEDVGFVMPELTQVIEAGGFVTPNAPPDQYSINPLAVMERGYGEQNLYKMPKRNGPGGGGNRGPRAASYYQESIGKMTSWRGHNYA